MLFLRSTQTLCLNFQFPAGENSFFGWFGHNGESPTDWWSSKFSMVLLCNNALTILPFLNEYPYIYACSVVVYSVIDAVDFEVVCIRRNGQEECCQ